MVNTETIKPSTTPAGSAPVPQSPDQTIDPDEPIGDDGVNYDVYADDTTSQSSTPTANDASAVDFSSKDIKKRKKTDYFINVEGAEKSKRESERSQAAEEKRKLNKIRRDDRAAKAAEKAAANKRTRQQKYDDAQEKNARKEVAAEEKRQHKLVAAEKRKAKRELSREKRKALAAKLNKRFWAGKHKIFTISGAVVLTAAILCCIFIVNPYVKQQKELAAAEAQRALIEKQDKESVQKADSILDEIYRAIDNGEPYLLCVERFKNALEQADNNPDKISITIAYAEYIYNETDDANSATEMLETVSSLISTDSQKERFYPVAIKLYSETDNETAMQYYIEQYRMIKPELFKKGGE